MTMHEGHRKRMRERFRSNGLEGFAHHEALELLLFYGRARGDTNALAHSLLDAFGSLKGVLEAAPEQLMTVNGIGEETATLISLMLPMFRRYAVCVCEERRKITNRSEAADYCKTLLAGWRTEHFYVICLNSAGQVLGRRKVAEGTLTEVLAYPRLVVETALNYNAHSVVLCHNHPSGDPTASPEDVRTTRQLQQLLAALSITLLDHIIVAGESTYSMVQHGQIDLRQLLAGTGMPPSSLGKETFPCPRRKRKENDES